MDFSLLLVVLATSVTLCRGGPVALEGNDSSEESKVELSDTESGELDIESQPDEEYINSLLPKDKLEALNLYGGDIKLTPDQRKLITEMEKEQRESEHGIEKRAVITRSRDMWPNGRVPYIISSRLGSSARSAISSAIEQYNRDTCIRFVQRTTERDYVRFIRDNGCYSYIGRTGGAQDISIGSGCESKGVVMHEMFHALGRWHEQSRPDRDSFIRVNYGNIERGAESNFEKLRFSQASTNSLAYDFRSLMHYSAYSFSRNRQPTIEPIVANVRINDLGQRGGFTTQDRNHALRLYCNNQPPPVTVSTWSSWSSWSSCSRSCDTGSQSRTRTCQGTSCVGSNRQTRACNTNTCPRWGTWSNWGRCSATCNGGRQTRYRSCIVGRCSGSYFDTRACNTNACSRWSSWSNWGSCSATCNGGRQTRTRSCIGGTCSGSGTDTRNCGTTACAGRWSSWSNWGSCSTECGAGKQSRTRSCAGGFCSGAAKQTRDCVKAPLCLRASGEWSAWGSWSSCSAECGYAGRQSRMRTCNGNTCAGSNREIQKCNRGTCASALINGPGWGAWRTWSRCTRSCGGGYQSRRKICTATRTHRRTDCPGSSFQIRGCNYQSCSTPAPSVVAPPTGDPFTAEGFVKLSCREVDLTTSNSAIYTLNSSPFTSNIVQNCVNLAASRGFHYVGVSGGYCNSGSDSENSYTRHPMSTRCVGGTGLLLATSLRVYMDVYRIQEN